MADQPSGHAADTFLLGWVKDEASRAAIEAVINARQSKAQIVSGTANHAAKYLADHPSPPFLVVEVTSADAAQKQLDALAEVVNPATKVIVTGTVDSYRFYHWLMELGVHDYLLQPITPEALAASLAKGEAKQASAEAAAPRKLITTIGARGGVGATTIATHLAAIFAKEHELPTALVDPDAHFGSVALGLDLEPVRGLKDALEKPDRIDGLFLDRVMVKPFAGLSILSAEEPLHESVAVEEGAAASLVAALHEPCAMVVVDVPRQMSSFARDILSAADAVLLVAEPNVLSLRDMLRIKDYVVERLKRPAPKLVVNKRGAVAGFELHKSDIAKHYGAEPAVEIAYTAEALAAITRGETLLANTKAHAFMDPLRTLAETLSGKTSPVKPVSGSDSVMALLSKLRKKVG